MNTTIEKAGSLKGSIKTPGDKSIAHRALILGALADGRQRIEGAPNSADLSCTLQCLRSLGCNIEDNNKGALEVVSTSWKQDINIYAGNSGTTARLITGLAAGAGVRCTIDGDASLRSRPMDRIATPLIQMGADVSTTPENRLPLVVKGGGLKGISYRTPVPSAQVKSAVLIAGLFATGRTSVIENALSRDHTERMLTAMSVDVELDGLKVTVKGGAIPSAIDMIVPGDISSALFFIVASLISRGGEVRLCDIGVNPTRIGALDLLKKMGANILIEDKGVSSGEPIADIVARPSQLQGIEISGPVIPSLIDEAPILAVAATQAEGTTILRDAGELRFKESDRIEATVKNLQKLGASIESLDDGFVINGPCRLKGNKVSSYDDHRIAMAMAVAGLIAEGKTVIEHSEAVDVSYPGFFKDLQSLTHSF